MRSPLEQFIRPFQTVDITPPVRVIEDEKAVEPVLVEIGKDTEGKTFINKYFLFENFTVEDDKTQIEVSRTEKTKRVTNPDDPEQHVDVATMSTLRTRNKANPNDYANYEFKDQG